MLRLILLYGIAWFHVKVPHWLAAVVQSYMTISPQVQKCLRTQIILKSLLFHKEGRN